MSLETTYLCKKTVIQFLHAHASEMPNGAIQVFDEGNLFRFCLSKASGGQAEIVCGPPEYHAEFFLNLPNAETLNINQLIRIPRVAEWISHKAVHPKSNEHKCVHEITFYLDLFVEVIQHLPEFGWIRESP